MMSNVNFLNTLCHEVKIQLKQEKLSQRCDSLCKFYF